MTFDSLSEPAFLHAERSFRSYPYRDASLDEPYLRTSQSQRVHPTKQSSARTLHQFFRDHKAPVTFDRLTYKMRMKSDLQVKTLRDPDLRHYHRHRSQHSNERTPQRIPPAQSGRSATRQPTANTLTSQTVKSISDDELRGIEGNAVHVGTLDDIIKQFHRTEIHLIHQPLEPFQSHSAYFSSQYVAHERPIIKAQTERIVKQAQAPTEYRFPIPSPTMHRPRPIPQPPPTIEEYHRPSLSSPVTQPERLFTALSLSEKRSQGGREKQMCVCNKLTIVDPFNSPPMGNQQTSIGYIFPPIRPSGYFTKKTSEEPSPLPKKRRAKKKRKKIIKQSSESLDQLSLDDESISQGLDETMKSMVSLATSEEDLINPSNTFINIQSAIDTQPEEP